MDSNEGGPEESDSKLEEGIDGGVGGDVLGKPQPKHLGCETGCLRDDSVPCGWGPGVLLSNFHLFATLS